MTRKHYIQAASIVKAIVDNLWSHEAPSWAVLESPNGTYDASTIDDASERNMSYTRAVQTAEAFILLFANDNPRFNRERFLSACGLR